MTPTDVKETLAFVAKLFPKGAWPIELQTETARRMAALPISAEQGRAAITNCRMSLKFQTVQPCEILDALRGAVPNDSPGRGDANAGEVRAKAARSFFERNPYGFWVLAAECHEALGLPRHYLQAVACFWEFPRSRDWIAARIPTNTSTNDAHGQERRP